MISRGFGFNINPISLPAGGSSDRFSIMGTLANFFNDVGSVSTTETDLYSYTVKANTLNTNGSGIFAFFSGTMSSGTSNKNMRIYFAGTQIFATGALNTGGSLGHFAIYVNMVRTNSNHVRTTITAHSDSNTNFSTVSYVDVTPVDLTTNLILKLTGQASGAGAADNDVVARFGSVQYLTFV